MKKRFDAQDWKNYVPIPVCEQFPEYEELYWKAWELARAHVKSINGMPQTPYMDEAFCDTQIWIWDTCFMSLFCKYAQEVFPGIESLSNFYNVLYGKESLPKILPTEKEPKWTGAVTAVPFGIEIHIADNPPLFAWAEYENAVIRGDYDYIKELLYRKQVLQKHYDWVENLSEKSRLKGVHSQTYLICTEKGYKWEGGRSGMDNTPRGRLGARANAERPSSPDMLWIDAICQQALTAKKLAELFEIVGDGENRNAWHENYLQKRKLINELYWDSADNFYYDIDCNTEEFYKVKTIASYWALIAKIPSAEQAEFMAKYAADPNHFGGDVPLVSLSRSDADYSPQGNYWRGSMWLPTAYAALKGLCEYGYHELARESALKILNHMLLTYKEYEPHTIWEAYAPCDHSPATNESGTQTVRPDFCGWSALGPISAYIECVLGFYKINAFENVVFWDMPSCFDGKIGIKNLRFGNVITDIVSDGKEITVRSDSRYVLNVNGRVFNVESGMSKFVL